MADAFAKLKRGEKRPLYAVIEAEAGAITVEPTDPSPVCTLFRADGSVVSGLSGLQVSGYNEGPLVAPKVWFNLDTTSPSLEAGFYTLVFRIGVTGSDGIARVYRPSMVVEVCDETA